jgi:hypothetical protein
MLIVPPSYTAIATEAKDPMDMEENYVIQQLNTELTPQFAEIYNEREFISEELQRKKVEVFGKDANNFAYAEGATTFQREFIAEDRQRQKEREVFGKDANNFAYAEGATTFQREFIAEDRQRQKEREVFGKDANNFAYSEGATFQSSPPEELEQGIDPNTPVNFGDSEPTAMDTQEGSAETTPSNTDPTPQDTEPVHT